MWGIGRDSGSGFFILLFVLTIPFGLVSAGIFKANIAAYAKKSEGSSGGDKSDDGGGSKGWRNSTSIMKGTPSFIRLEYQSTIS